ncbi:hypothetical protein [Helicobacter cinaedi]|uniref:Outer membrane protein n=1 Tax=Helicobacter cinaedi CCUG 18818 = ATCC BAA-847 TaxID=537971 RepID=A0ABN0BB07_9HELI|nr:hypothetical protein [Helicobacter cinaedi]EFR46763.1 hypothetical protein HCCG_01310 [Helicobacter cinaedi CCUG 18818 = ATCC BAA-847]
MGGILKRFLLSLFVLSVGQNLLAVDFSPAPIYENNSTFGSVSIGGVAYNVKSKQGYDNTRGAVLFGLKRGFLLGDSKKVLLNAWLEGSAGVENKNGLYSGSVGGQIGYRLFNGLVIVLLGGGFEMSNLAMPHIPKEQYNIYGGLARAELFIDIAQGYGLSVGYTRGFNEKSKKIKGESFDTQGIMLSVSFYDFSI